MSTKSVRRFEAIGPEHSGMLAAATLSGVDTSPVVGGSERFIGYGDTKYGYGPVCVLDLIGTPYVVEPHVVWFPWTTTSQKVAHFKWAVEFLRKSRHVLLNVEKAHKDFFDHFARKGFIRKVGVLEELPVVGEIHIYQIKRS